MTKEWTYEELQSEVAGKFEKLSDYKEFARNNKDLDYPVSPDLYFKKRGLEVWSAKDFLGEYNPESEKTTQPEPVKKQEAAEENIMDEPNFDDEDDVDLEEDLEEQVSEMEDFIDDKKPEKVKPEKVEQAEIEDEGLIEESDDEIGDSILETIKTNIRTQKLLDRHIRNSICTERTDLDFGNVKVFSTSVMALTTMNFYYEGSIIFFHLEKTDDGFMLVFVEPHEKDIPALEFLLSNLPAFFDVPFKNGKKNYFEMTEQEKSSAFIMKKGDYKIFTLENL